MINIKQNITQKQLESLSDYQIEVLYNYWWDKNNKPRNQLTPTVLIEYGTGTLYKLPLLSIGDMLEYINQKIAFSLENSKTLCDDLWGMIRCII